jgi:hypothetical protein
MRGNVYPQMSRISQIQTSPKMANSEENFACTRGNGNCEPLNVHRFRAVAAKCWTHGRESRPIRQCQTGIESIKNFYRKHFFRRCN